MGRRAGWLTGWVDGRKREEGGVKRADEREGTLVGRLDEWI